MIGYAVCGSFCTHKKSIEVLKRLKEKYNEILPILSFNSLKIDTRFGRASDLLQSMSDICETTPITTLEDAEPIGPQNALEVLIIAPCTGNTLAKIAHGITDTPVTMAAKAHLRSNRPLLIALATNDGLSASLSNIAALLNRKNVYFVPMEEDDISNKPHSLVAKFDMIESSLEAALCGKQLLPLFANSRLF